MAVTTFKCVVALCERQCQDTQELIAHLKEHIVEGRAVSCPLRGCNTVTGAVCMLGVYMLGGCSPDSVHQVVP